MKGQKKKQSGITLIALVISIIVMLILAGVSINALMGDNGILKQAQFASFMSEMAAVEEAVQLWGADHYDDENHSIPAKGAVPQEEIDRGERLGGEIGYYRTWSRTNTMPITSVTTPFNSFNSIYLAELVFFPGGVEDLFYLDNDGLNLTSNKKYVIDAENSMVYSVQGISLNGVRCYSLEMAKAVMNGTYDAPNFIAAEVSGAQASGGIRAAGNNEPQYIDDGNGNLIENPNYNPNGFQIIGDASNPNIYKLYNNGDLYGKGKKGILLNSSGTEIESLNPNKWINSNIPDQIPGATSSNYQIVPGYNMVFVIDSNKDLWAWGSIDETNRLGLDTEQKNDYSKYNVTKLDLNGNKVSKVFSLKWATFVITVDNELLASGFNADGNLGIGKLSSETNSFEHVDFPEVQNIKTISDEGSNYLGCDYYNLILTTTGNLYFAGKRNWYSNDINVNINQTNSKTNSSGETCVCKWTKINFDEENYEGPNLANSTMIRYDGWGQQKFLFYDGEGVWKYYRGAFSRETALDDYTNNGMLIGHFGSAIFFGGENGNKKIFITICESSTSGLGVLTRYDSYSGWNDITDIIELPFSVNNVSKIYSYRVDSAIFYVLNNDKIYGSGANEFLGINNPLGLSTPIELTDLEKYSNLDWKYFNDSYLLIQDGKSIVGTNYKDILFRDEVLEKNWKKIATGVNTLKACTTDNNDIIAYIDNTGNLLVRGKQSTILKYAIGVDTTEEFKRIQEYNIDSTLKSKLNSGVKIKDYYIGNESFYILLNDGTFWATGPYQVNSWYRKVYHGLEEDEEHDIDGFELIRNDVKVFGARNTCCYLQTTDGDIYSWVSGNAGVTRNCTEYTEAVAKCDFGGFNDVGNISQIGILQNNCCVFLLADNGLFVSGLCRSDGITSGLGRYATYVDAAGNTRYAVEKITDFPTMNFSTYSNCGLGSFVLNNEGNVLGCGRGYYLGLGDETATCHMKWEKVYTKGDACQIASGNQWTVIVTTDGKVYGTGFNRDGILGRWSGADRQKTNSRYRTAYDWVECPELEI